ncbi:MAG: cell division protein FtsB [Chromatiales bacterium]|nr:cell division protein FtsB [Chromatiales bacterium]
MRIVLLVLTLLLLALQYPLWFGDGGYRDLKRLRAELAELREEIRGLKERNGALEAEVRSLADQSEAIEERARSELGMIRDGEVFYRVVPSANTTTSSD